MITLELSKAELINLQDILGGASCGWQGPGQGNSYADASWELLSKINWALNKASTKESNDT